MRFACPTRVADHEWVRLDGRRARVGITSYAQEALGDIVFVELPQVGHVYDAGDEIGTIESVKAVSNLYSPVSGEVVDINKDLPDNLDWLPQEPFGKAWMMKVRVTGKSSDLMDGKTYDAHCAAEA